MTEPIIEPASEQSGPSPAAGKPPLLAVIGLICTLAGGAVTSGIWLLAQGRQAGEQATTLRTVQEAVRVLDTKIDAFDTKLTGLATQAKLDSVARDLLMHERSDGHPAVTERVKAIEDRLRRIERRDR